MSTLVWSTSTGDKSRTQSAKSELVADTRFSIELRPDDGIVILGGHSFHARSIYNEFEPEEGNVIFFRIEGESWDHYAITIYEDRVEVSKSAMRDDREGPPSYFGDVEEVYTLRAFAHFVVKKLLPDYLEKQEQDASR